jgi:beta-mannosidase
MIIGERKLPILDGFWSKDDKICLFHIVSLRVKHCLHSNFHPKEEMLMPRSSRFVRKAQYHWGWDWGPAINTSGPWKEIWLETFTGRISQFIVRQEVAEDLESAMVSVKGSVEGATGGKTVEIMIEDPEGSKVVQFDAVVGEEGKFEAVIKVQQEGGLKLWYPFTYGEQPLYTITAKLPGLDEKSQKLGLRRLRLLQHELKNAPGTSFTFEINNKRIFAGGSCWIPGDFMLPRFTRERYEEWLLRAKAGNQVMIRVWGGGIVESDIFYEICDREGILVWQDFLFACGDYPVAGGFTEQIKEEATQQVKRVGHHARFAHSHPVLECLRDI